MRSERFQLIRYGVSFLMVVTLALAAPAMVFAQEAGAEGGEAPHDTNMLLWLAQVSGPIGLVILLMSFYFVAVCVSNFLELRSEVAAPPEVVEACERLIQEENPQGVLQLVKDDESFFGRSLSAGLSELSNSVDEGREKLERTADNLTVNMEKKITVLATIGTLGPLIGLLGTLKGMISSFMQIALSGKALDAAKVAEGISEALVITFEGVALSIPAIFLYAMFRNRISKISGETTMLADDYYRAIVRLLKRPRGAKPAAPASSPAPSAS